MAPGMVRGTQRSTARPRSIPVKPGGAIPTTVNGWPFKVTARPTRAGSAPNRRRQKPSLTTSAGAAAGSTVLERPEDAAPSGGDARHLEVVRGHELAEDPIRLAPFAQAHGSDGVGREPGEGVGLLAKIEVVGIRRPSVEGAAVVARVHRHYRGGVAHRKWAKKERVDEAEDRGVGADAEADRQQGHESESRALREHPHGVAQVVDQRVHRALLGRWMTSFVPPRWRQGPHAGQGLGRSPAAAAVRSWDRSRSRPLTRGAPGRRSATPRLQLGYPCAWCRCSSRP